jgi:hypothetical protein
MERYGGPHTSITIILHGGLLLYNIMDLYEGPPTALIIFLHGGLYLHFILVRN